MDRRNRRPARSTRYSASAACRPRSRRSFRNGAPSGFRRSSNVFCASLLGGSTLRTARSGTWPIGKRPTNRPSAPSRAARADTRWWVANQRLELRLRGRTSPRQRRMRASPRRVSRFDPRMARYAHSSCRSTKVRTANRNLAGTAYFRWISCLPVFLIVVWSQ